jgi:hypothetical protein
MTTFEEAKRCPKCKVPGAEVNQRPGPLGSRVHSIECRNSRCRWYQTKWLVQIQSDGSIQEATEHEKRYPKVHDRTDSVQVSMDSLLNQTLKGGEIR